MNLAFQGKDNKFFVMRLLAVLATLFALFAPRFGMCETIIRDDPPQVAEPSPTPSPGPTPVPSPTPNPCDICEQYGENYQPRPVAAYTDCAHLNCDPTTKPPQVGEWEGELYLDGRRALIKYFELPNISAKDWFLSSGAVDPEFPMKVDIASIAVTAAVGSQDASGAIQGSEDVDYCLPTNLCGEDALPPIPHTAETWYMFNNSNPANLADREWSPNSSFSFTWPLTKSQYCWFTHINAAAKDVHPDWPGCEEGAADSRDDMTAWADVIAYRPRVEPKLPVPKLMEFGVERKVEEFPEGSGRVRYDITEVMYRIDYKWHLITDYDAAYDSTGCRGGSGESVGSASFGVYRGLKTTTNRGVEITGKISGLVGLLGKWNRQTVETVGNLSIDSPPSTCHPQLHRRDIPVQMVFDAKKKVRQWTCNTDMSPGQYASCMSGDGIGWRDTDDSNDEGTDVYDRYIMVQRPCGDL